MGNEASKAVCDNRTDATPTNIRQMTQVALVIVSLLVIMVASFNAVHADVFTQVGTLPLKTGENLLGTAVVDSVNGYAYLGTQTSPGMIVKVRLSDFTEVGTLPLQSGENVLASGVIDPISGYAYFGTAKLGSAGIIVKIRLSDFTEVAALNTSLPGLSSAVIDSANGFAYFGTNSHVLLNPDNVVKIRLSDFTENKTLTLKPGENGLNSAVIDAANGFAYFGTAIGGPPVTVAKIRLSDLSEVGDLTLNTVAGLDSAVIDSLNGYAYFGSETPPGVIVKVRLSDLTEVSDLPLNTGEERLGSAVIDSSNGFAYFGTLTTPGIVVKVRLSDFTEVGALNTGEGELSSAAIDSLNGFAYFGTFTSPGVIAKVETAAFDYALSSAGMISVRQGGSGSALVTATLTSSPAQPVTLQCVSSTLPSGASCSFDPATITPTPTGGGSQLTVHTASSTPTGSFQVKVIGSPPGTTTTAASTTVSVTVTAKDNTSTAVSDVSCTIALGATSCTTAVTAVVSDLTTPTNSPTGTVTFTLTAGSTGGSLDSQTCVLILQIYSRVTSCWVTFTGTAAGSGSIVATYDGDAAYNTSTSSTATVSVVVATPFDFSLTGPGSVTIPQGTSSTRLAAPIVATLTGGSTTPVTFSITSMLPSGVTAAIGTLSPLLGINQCTPSCTVGIGFTASLTAAIGTYTVVVQAAGGGVTKTVSFSLTVEVAYSFSLSTPSPDSLTVVQGSTSVSSSITATVVSGSSTRPLGFLVTSTTLPAGITPNFTPIQCNPLPTCTVTVSFTAADKASTGIYTLTILALGGGSQRTQLALTVVAPSFSAVSCGHNESCSVLSNATQLGNIRLAGNTLHVEADGPHGEHSYANVSIPKSEIPQIDQLHVFVDGNKLEASAVIITSNSTMYFVYFSFTFHSPVMIDIQLTAPQHTPNAPTILGLDPALFYEIVGGVAVVAVIVVVAALVFRRRRSRITPQNQP